MSSDYLEELIARATKGNDFWDMPVKPIERTEETSVRRDSFDEMTWAYVTDQMPVLKDQVDDLGADFETSPPAYEDLFNLLNQTDPRFRPEDVLKEPYVPQAMLMNAIGASEEFRHLRNLTVLDEYNTGFAMLTMRDKMRKAFEDLSDAIAAAQALSEAVAAALAAAEEALASGEGTEEAAEGLAAALAAAAAGQDATQEQVDGMALRLQDAANQAASEIKADQDAAAAFGTSKGQLQKMSYAERLALSQQLNQGRLKKLAQIIGAQRMSGTAERRRSVHSAPARMARTKLGNDLTKLLPQEILNLAIPELEDSFWIRWAKRRLRLRDWQGPAQLDRGPMIVVCDESGSMGAVLDTQGNTREMWSKAVTLALADQARHGKRDFIYIGFASRGEQWEMVFPGGEIGLPQTIQFTEHFFCGGTSYEGPLTRAGQIITDYVRAKKPRPDVVFITDADCRVRPGFKEEWAEIREQADVRCYGIQIGGGSGYHNDMQDLVDRCMSIDKLNATPDGVQELFRNLT